jgi:predicted house-cleaning noncanonical NTP pyrophosphatase (MazG superfamily)
VKLVRDNIPFIIEQSGKTCEYHVANYGEYKARLYEKMREELDEFIEAPSYEEAADMWEVFAAICELHQLDLNHVKSTALEKGRKRGAFKDRIVLEKVN